ncbi:hypothetical protein B0H16DRAFT_1712365 [Mycena metata]|uniref:Uncharacterized protein n=1 Tax=Mycena metata TaxID=1033252 RepID=A0AAD7K7N8_9AGAR|nr:hypothetical protein B0H16DRAFT_1712365 [Mycena metata]
MDALLPNRTQEKLFEVPTAPQAGPSRRIGFLAVVPGLLTVVVSWGLATALLSWLFKTRITDHASNEDLFFQGALVAIERATAPIHNVDGTVEAQSKLYGLTISSLSSTVVRATIPLVFGLFAFLVAADWLRAQAGGEMSALPTPPQYGMMVYMFSSASAKSLLDYWSFFGRPAAYATAPPVAALKKCLVALVILLTFNYAMMAGDLWLHLRTTSFIHHRSTVLPADGLSSYLLGAAINTTACPGPISVSDPTDATAVLPAGYAYNCLDDIADNNGGTANINSWGTGDLLGVAVTTMRGQYTANQVYVVGDFAVISRPNLPSVLNGAVFETFALKSECQPANCTDVPTAPGQGSYECADFSPTFSYSYDGTDASTNIVHRFNPADKSLMNVSYPLTANINPTGAIAAMNYATTMSTTQGRFGNDSMPGWLSSGGGNGGHVDAFIAQCTVTVYTVKVQLQNLTLTLVGEPVLTDFNTTSALTAAFESLPSFTDGAPLQSFLMNFLADTFQYADLSDENAFLGAFSRNLSVAGLSLASPLVRTLPITAGAFVDSVSASRYEWAPLLFSTGVMYIYGLGTLLLCLSVALAASPTVIQGDKVVKTAQLLHLRLTDPLVVIADRFVDGTVNTGLEKSAREMFAAGENRRLGAGHGLRRRQTFGVEVLSEFGPAELQELMYQSD